MAKDRRLKQKRKREKKRQLRREGLQRLRRQEKAGGYAAAAAAAFRDQDFDCALDFALERLRLGPLDRIMVSVAVASAKALGNEAALYRLLQRYWKAGVELEREDYLWLGRAAAWKKDDELAKEVLEQLMAGTLPLDRPLTKAQVRDVERLLWYLHAKIERPPRSSRSAPKRRPAVPAPEAPSPPVADPGEEELEPEAAFTVEAEPVLEAIAKGRAASIEDFDLAVQGYELSFRSSFDRLLCLPTLRSVESLWYQEETARKVMKTFRGRAILADEVGLGKTIEAGLVLKEYVLRGLVRTALILTPSALVTQWQEELEGKFGLSFVSTNDTAGRRGAGGLWEQPRVIASINVAKSKRNFDAVTSRSYDMVIVDEAHHLKNRTTWNWKLVDAIHKDFLLLLTATPVENNLEELHNLVTLVRPGHLKTRGSFRAEFMSRGNPTDPRNREELRQLLKEVMIRTTRSVAKLELPPRFATTVRVEPEASEQRFYEEISAFVAAASAGAAGTLQRRALQGLLAAAGSSPAAAAGRLEKISERYEGDMRRRASELRDAGRRLGAGAKAAHVRDLLAAGAGPAIVFVNTLTTLEHLERVFSAQGIDHVFFHGGLAKARKQAAMDRFQDGCPVLLSTGTGGEGHNLQFCHTMINYDLPWNPMAIEQRIGRIHRIGQTKEVRVFNFCAAGTLEDYMLEVLDRKINMFELVIGEVDMVLGRLRGEQEFDDLVYELWIQNPDGQGRLTAFNSLAERLKRARRAYEKSKELDEKLFQEDFGV